MARSRSGPRTKILTQLCEQYAQEFSVDVLDLDEVADWAIANGLWDENPTTPKQRCKREIARALRRAHHTDPQNRDVRTWHAALVEDNDGQMRWEWGDMRVIEPSFMRVSQQYGRRQILDHCRQHSLVTDSYNDNNAWAAFLQPTDYDFNLDLEEEQFPEDYPEEPDDS